MADLANQDREQPVPARLEGEVGPQVLAERVSPAVARAMVYCVLNIPEAA